LPEFAEDEAMGAMLDAVRSGDWVTRERMRLVAFGLLIAFAAGLAWLAGTANGLNDAWGRPLGTDFSNVYAAGTLVLDGQPQAPFDPALQYAREQAIFGAQTPFYGWHYPPFFLFIAAALALMPYTLALLAWQVSTLALYLLALRAIVGNPESRVDLPPRDEGGGSPPAQPDPLWLVLALAFPAVFINLGHGHNGFLTAALIGAALVSLDRRPLLAGVLIGLIAYKPQLGILFPLVLAATGRWRSFAAAAATIAALAVITTFAFGISVWDAFLASTHFTRIIVLEAGETGWHKIQSVFSLVRMWGGSVALAYAAQSAITVTMAAALVWLWRAQVDFSLKAAALIIAALLATPYSLDYDMTALAPAIAFLAVNGLRHGFAPYEKSALAVLWIAPLVARSIAQAILVPVSVLAMGAVLGLVLHRAAQETRLIARWHPSQHRAS
jgi:alpha-1,2-mannosyltransferase